MLRHDNECVEIETMRVCGCTDALSKQPDPPLIRQEWLALVARERQFMGVAWLIEVLDLLAVVGWELHGREDKSPAGKPPVERVELGDTGGQAASGTGQSIP